VIDELLKIMDERIEMKVSRINTIALGIITQVDHSKLRCNVKLKHKIRGREIELFDVPVACLKSSVGTIYIPLQEGDIVLVLFSKYELEEQLKNKQTVAVNELLKFNINNAIVFAGVFTLAESIPEINPNRINIIGDVYINGDLDFKTIRGVNADDGVWHNPP